MVRTHPPFQPCDPFRSLSALVLFTRLYVLSWQSSNCSETIWLSGLQTWKSRKTRVERRQAHPHHPTLAPQTHLRSPLFSCLLVANIRRENCGTKRGCGGRTSATSSRTKRRIISPFHFSIGRKVDKGLSSTGFVIASEGFVFLFLFCSVFRLLCSGASPSLLFYPCHISLWFLLSFEGGSLRGSSHRVEGGLRYVLVSCGEWWDLAFFFFPFPFFCFLLNVYLPRLCSIFLPLFPYSRVVGEIYANVYETFINRFKNEIFYQP